LEGIKRAVKKGTDLLTKPKKKTQTSSNTTQEPTSFLSLLSSSLQTEGDLGPMPSPFLSLLFILITTIPSTYYLYNHPRLHACAWPDPSAPFRLLALADPQIEGDKKQKSWRGISRLREKVDRRSDRYLGQ
jgi:hypothetical protein